MRIIKTISKEFILFFLLTSFGYSQSAPVITSNGGGGMASISYAEQSTFTVTTVTSTDADAGISDGDSHGVSLLGLYFG